VSVPLFTLHARKAHLVVRDDCCCPAIVVLPSPELLELCSLFFSNETKVGWLFGTKENLSSSAAEEMDPKTEGCCFAGSVVVEEKETATFLG